MTRVQKIAESFAQLLPLFDNKVFKPIIQATPIPKKQSDLTHLQFHILEALFHAKTGISMTQLAQNLRISKQQLTPLIRKLEEKDYVVKVQSSTDRRFVILTLTEKGKQIVQKRWEEIYRLFCDKIGKLSEDDLIDLDYAITKLVRIMAKLE
ncbi:MarR family winged helix-turn-helix transcriptional regulator [Thermaerobacillus caldiproteolyticus]|uniref:DNA-binding MarR family transcriptional regulator n=1 Tax=Thermaerobacillus caldiproteolyticus TaxID=247480 RepID=A0A7V9Z7Z8_9BACL|nr:MarR family transcriptional regulator [Anoxybacillus caldiproteolyticus]MBA2875749.1 DNA-binding MarR family transcriptional regulator [Anoxybacillus caldiproteolyticus]